MRLIDADALARESAEFPHSAMACAFIKRIEEAPTVEVEIVKHGKWIPTHESGMFSHPYSITYVCSECGNKIYTLMGTPQVTEYCSKCGAKMDIIEANDG